MITDMDRSYVLQINVSDVYFSFESYSIADDVNEYKIILSIAKDFVPWSKNLSHSNQSTYLEVLDDLSVKLSQSSLKPALMIHEQMNMRIAAREFT